MQRLNTRVQRTRCIAFASSLAADAPPVRRRLVVIKVAFKTEQFRSVKADFVRLKRLTAVGLLIIGLPLGGVIFGIRGRPVLGLGVTGWLIIWVAVAACVSLWFRRIWRCPACGASLGQPPSAAVCRKCGIAFE